MSAHAVMHTCIHLSNTGMHTRKRAATHARTCMDVRSNYMEQIASQRHIYSIDNTQATAITKNNNAGEARSDGQKREQMVPTQTMIGHWETQKNDQK